MPRRFRLVDTGLRTGRENIALDQAMVDARLAGEIPDTLRFIGFKPSALVGRHQAVQQELKPEYCRAHGIEIGRRITGGGAIYMDEGILGWALVCDRRTLGGALPDITRAICEAAARGLSKLGVDARFRPRNDIEVDGRKISGTGGFFDGDALIYQGTVLGALAPQTMLSVLNVPQAKLEKRALDNAAQRVVTLAELLDGAPDWGRVKDALARGFAEGLGIEFEPGVLSEAEEARARRLHEDEIGTDRFVYEIDDPAGDRDVRAGAHTGAGGTVTAYVRLEGANNSRFREILFCGDFFVAPPRVVLDLEACLRGVSVTDAEQRVQTFFGELDGGCLLSIGANDFIAALRAATAEALA
ncbi:MAG: biotin/lipoate A/B protein ligase family protein [Hyphomonadaceae bacterium]